MKDFTQFLVSALVEHPADVVLTTEEKDGVLEIGVNVHPDDLGKVIGRKGKTARAMRSLVGVMAERTNTPFRLTILEPQKEATQEESDPEDVPHEPEIAENV